VPSTDNALESTNRQLKEKGTFRQRLPCGQFVNIVENKLLKDFSTSRNPFCIKNGIQVPNLDYENHCYNDEPKIELKIWKDAYSCIIFKKYFWERGP